jgi:hypothetical protein
VGTRLESSGASSAATTPHRQQGNQTKTTLAEMLLVRTQHHTLYPDPLVDKLPFYGIISLLDSATFSHDCAHVVEILQKIQTRYRAAPDSHNISSAENWVYRMLMGSKPATGPQQVVVNETFKRVGLCAKRVAELAQIDYQPVPYKVREVGEGATSEVDARVAGGEGEAAPLGTPRSVTDTDHDEKTGKLTYRGREKLLRGQLKCRSLDVRPVRDELDMPIYSYEWPALARFLVSELTI